jgi:hypothetical protein
MENYRLLNDVKTTVKRPIAAEKRRAIVLFPPI